jgi:predicted AlkP superfamily phosphohydrolase/phosphomutase
MPFLREWTTAGTRAKLQFSTPLSSVAAWMTLITGRSPAQHGIFNLFRKQSPQAHGTLPVMPSGPVWTGKAGGRQCSSIL